MIHEEDLIPPNSRWFCPNWHREGRVGKWHRLRGLVARGRTRGAICARCLHSRRV